MRKRQQGMIKLPTHSRQGKAQEQPQKPLLYDLPGATALLQTAAFSQGMYNATLAWKDKLKRSEVAIQAMLQSSAANQVRNEIEGRCGTNNLELFHEIFSAAYLTGHRSMNALLERSEEVRKELFGQKAQDRAMDIWQYAAQHVDLLQGIAPGQVIDLPH